MEKLFKVVEESVHNIKDTSDSIGSTLGGLVDPLILQKYIDNIKETSDTIGATVSGLEVPFINIPDVFENTRKVIEKQNISNPVQNSMEKLLETVRELNEEVKNKLFTKETQELLDTFEQLVGK